jgi:hypothetical protein
MIEAAYPWFWALWALAGVAVEGAALWGRRHPKDTLSRNIQFVVLGSTAKSRITLAGWVGFSVWFAHHIWA